MLVIGSKALDRLGLLPEGRGIKDLDLIVTEDEAANILSEHKDKSEVIKTKYGYAINTGSLILELDVAVEGSTSLRLLSILNAKEGIIYADLNTLYTLKMSHRFLKDSPHFTKTRNDIKLMVGLGAKIPTDLQNWFIKREKETYDYSHPNLNVDKESFFKEDDGVPYIYDHDSIHKAVAIHNDPAYLSFKPVYQQVLCSKEMFDNCEYYIKLYSVVEESMVLALERSLVPLTFKPNADDMFRFALMKVCTSITSGWWRTWAYDNYDNALIVYKELGSKYMENSLNEGLRSGIVVPHKVSSINN